MPRTLDQEIRTFERRVDAYAFLGGAAEGALVGAATLLAGVLVVRLLQVPFTPRPWLLGFVATAALLGGLARLRRLGFGARDSAEHLDRRLGLQGLLLTAREADASAWRHRLDAALASAKAARPHLAPRPLLARVALAGAALALVFLLPPVVAPARSLDQLAAETLADFEARLEQLEEEQGLDEEVAEELRDRLEGLQAQQERSGTMAWEDFDALAARLQHEQELEVGRLAKAAATLSALAQDGGRGENQDPQESLDELRELAAEAGLLDKLPDDLADALGLGEGAAGSDGMALDAETLAQLAAALAGLAGQELTGLADLGPLQGLSAEELQQLLEDILAAAKAGNPCSLCEGGDKDCPG